YRVEEGWGTLPDGRKWGGTIGVDIDRDGNIWVFERCGGTSCEGSSLAPIIKLDRSGKLLKMFGEGMFNQPHGFHVDRDGNVWARDASGKDQRPPGIQIQPRWKSADDARQGWSCRRRARHV